MADLASLRQIAEAATPGPWAAHHLGDESEVYSGAELAEDGSVLSYARQVASVAEDEMSRSFEQADAVHIATFDPSTVLALLDVAEAAHHLDADLTPATRLALGDALADLREAVTRD